MNIKKAYIVEINSDFTEGCGPMRFESIWLDGDAAIEYVSGKEGIYGSPQRVELNKYGYFAYANGYLIREVEFSG